MANSSRSSLSHLAKQYVQCKSELQKALIAEGVSPAPTDDDSIAVAEQALELSFADLIAAQVKNLDDLSVKAHTFINETLSETELANYHKQSLLAILDDIARLRKTEIGKLLARAPT